MQENNPNENQTPFTLYAEKARLILQGDPEPLTAGMTGVVEVRFTFSADWAGLAKTAVFSNGVRTVRVEEAYWDEGVCLIPREVLRTAGKTVMAGVYGTNGLHLVLPTVWCVLGRVEPAPDLSGEPVDPGPSLRALERRLEALEQIPPVTEDTVSGWGFTQNAITQHQSLSGLVPRAAQAVKTQLHTQAVAIDEDGALYCAPGDGVRLIHAAYYDGEYYSDTTPAQIFAALSEADAPFVLIDRYGRQCPLLSPPEDAVDSPAKFFTIDPSGSELVIHTVGASGVISTQTAPLPARTSDLSNDSGFVYRFPVTITSSNGTASSDKTLAQILSAIQSGAVVDVLNGSLRGWVADADATTVTFYFIDTGGGHAVLYEYVVNALGVTETSKVIENNETTVQAVSGSTPSISALDDHVYECGVVSSLTVTAATSTGEFTLIFTSGATAATLTLPQAISDHMPVGFTVAANTRYEISVRKNYPVIASWAVSA